MIQLKNIATVALSLALVACSDSYEGTVSSHAQDAAVQHDEWQTSEDTDDLHTDVAVQHDEWQVDEDTYEAHMDANSDTPDIDGHENPDTSDIDDADSDTWDTNHVDVLQDTGPIAECESDAECDDADPCTVDSCNSDGQCEYGAYCTKGECFKSIIDNGTFARCIVHSCTDIPAYEDSPPWPETPWTSCVGENASLGECSDEVCEVAECGEYETSSGSVWCYDDYTLITLTFSCTAGNWVDVGAWSYECPYGCADTQCLTEGEGVPTPKETECSVDSDCEYLVPFEICKEGYDGQSYTIEYAGTCVYGLCIHSYASELLYEQGCDDLPVDTCESTGGGGPLAWPTDGRCITCGFECENYPYANIFPHKGIDIKATQGTPVMAAADGYVIAMKQCSDLDCYSYVFIAHEQEGLSTIYGHLSEVYIPILGQPVAMGDIIGLSGGTPNTLGAGSYSTGQHLHFEVRLGVALGSVPVDPLPYLMDN